MNVPNFAGMDRDQLVTECQRLHDLINQPHTEHFLEATRAEIAHQVERWGTVHDRAKEPQDWYWLLAYLAGKLMRAQIDGDTEKALHHTISSAAVLGNWWAHIVGADRSFTPGSSDLQRFLLDTFGSALPVPAAEASP